MKCNWIEKKLTDKMSVIDVKYIQSFGQFTFRISLIMLLSVSYSWHIFFIYCIL